MPRGSFVDVELEAAEQPAQVAVADENPVRILAIGNFGGRAGKRPALVDRDNFDDVLRAAQVAIGPLPIRELDDFHPDRIFSSLEVFATLRKNRERLMAGDLPPAAAEPDPSVAAMPASELLDRMVEEASPGFPSAQNALDDFDLLVHRIVQPHIQPKPDPRRAELVSQVDEAIAEQMRRILHHPGFQAVEAAWRGLFFLVRRLETSERLKLYILDVKDPETAVEETVRVVLEEPIGSEPWSLIAVNFTFGESARDLESLAMLAAIGRTARAPVLAAASPRLLGCRSLAETPDPRRWQPDPEIEQPWAKLRTLPEAGWIGLALPRFLLRLPYGEHTSPIETFRFEEMTGAPRHEDYLWGNPVWALVSLHAESRLEIDGLPLHVYPGDGEPCLKPCAETLLTEAAAGHILDSGLMPLVSIKGADRARLLRFQTITAPPRALPW